MKSFQPVCTVPPAGTNFVDSSTIRGTMDIVWNCLSILTLCTWSIAHLNVPVERITTTWLQGLNAKLYKLFRKVSWMVMIMIFPEIQITLAYCDLQAAYKHYKRMLGLASEDQVEWTISHSFLCNMGGFAIQFPDGRPEYDANKFTGKEKPTTGSHSLNSKDQNSENQPRSSIRDSPPAQQFEYSHDDLSGLEQQSHGHRLSISLNGGKKEEKRSRDHSSPQVVDASVVPSDSRLLEAEFWGWYGGDIKRESLSVVAMVQKLEQDSKFLGKSVWRLDQINQEIFNTAVETLQRTDLAEDSVTDLVAWLGNTIPLVGNIWVLDAVQLQYAREQGIISQLHDVTEAEISNLSNSDPVVKLLAVYQVLDLISQLATRVANGLSITQLEILAVSQAACAFFTYLLLLKKPKDIEVMKMVKATRYPTSAEIIKLGTLGPTGLGVSWPRPGIASMGIHGDGSDMKRIHLDAYAVILSGMVLFGGLHCLAWNLTFPTTVERLLWRISAVITIVLIPAGTALIYSIAAVTRLPESSKVLELIKVFGCIIVGLVYFAARVFVLVEVSRAMFYLPPDAFLDTDAANAPEVS